MLEELNEIVSDFPEVKQIAEPLLHMLFTGCEVVMAPIIDGDLKSIEVIAKSLEEAILASESFVKATIHLRLKEK